jgi:hypothetical protein
MLSHRIEREMEYSAKTMLPLNFIGIIYSLLIFCLLGVCFVAEDPKEREHLRKILLKAAPKLSPIKLRQSGRSQDEGANRLKDEMT